MTEKVLTKPVKTMKPATLLSKVFSAINRQREIYSNGVAGRKPRIPIDLNELQKQAEARMSKGGYTYVAGGAGREDSVRSNRSDFQRWQIQPRMFRDVSDFDTSIELFGQKLPTPFLLAPIGVLDMAYRNGDIATARAAAKLNVPMIFSNQASASMEAMSKEMGDSPRWFQLYWSKSYELVESLVNRAEQSGCSAIVVTLDTTMLGWRIQDLDLGFLPFMQGLGIAQYTSDPVFQKLMNEPITEESPSTPITFSTLKTLLALARNYPGSFYKNLTSGEPLRAVRKFTSIYTNPALNWEDLKFLRKRTSLPILLKGILHPEDAKIALDYGVDGIIVSNHGGRQLDGSISSIRALPEVLEAVGDSVPLLLDSGIRGGADVFKALALGAKAVCLGRPYVYGLALGGEAGIQEVIRNFAADFELTMRLAGCRNIKEISCANLLKS